MTWVADFYSMWLEMLRDKPLGTFFAVIVAVLVLFLAFMALVGIFIAADSWGVRTSERYGTVIKRDFTPAHIDTTWFYDAALKTSLPHIQSYPDEWAVEIEVDGQRARCDVSQDCYTGTREMDQVLATIGYGRISGALYCKGICRTINVGRIER